MKSRLTAALIGVALTLTGLLVLEGVSRALLTAQADLLERALAAAGWNRTRAARRLGMDRSTLWRKIREYGLQPEE